MIDVCADARVIRAALERTGWQYLGGGPYPHEPVLHFLREDGARIDVEIRSPKKEPKA